MRASRLLDERERAALLGLAFLILLVSSYFENAAFFTVLNALLHNQFLAVVMIFLHNVIIASLILLGMTFYVNLVTLNLFKKQKYEYTVLRHPKAFAILFTVLFLFLSILRGSTLLFGGINFEALPLILLESAPIGLIEGYGIYLTISKTLSRNMSIKDLAHIYGVFLIGALIEVGFISLLT